VLSATLSRQIPTRCCPSLCQKSAINDRHKDIRRAFSPAASKSAASVAMTTVGPVYWRLVGRAVPVVHSADTAADVCIGEGGRHLGTRRETRFFTMGKCFGW